MAGEVCGALSGAALAIGLLYGEQEPEAVTHLTGEFVQRFADMNGAVRCSDIIGFNLGNVDKTPSLGDLKGMLKFGMRGGKKMCHEIVSRAVEVLLDQLEEWES